MQRDVERRVVEGSDAHAVVAIDADVAEGHVRDVQTVERAARVEDAQDIGEARAAEVAVGDLRGRERCAREEVVEVYVALARAARAARAVRARDVRVGQREAGDVRAVDGVVLKVVQEHPVERDAHRATEVDACALRGAPIGSRLVRDGAARTTTLVGGGAGAAVGGDGQSGSRSRAVEDDAVARAAAVRCDAAEGQARRADGRARDVERGGGRRRQRVDD